MDEHPCHCRICGNNNPEHGGQPVTRCPATREAVQELEDQGGECLICGQPANRHPTERD
jgi:hypothetical protein